MNRFRFIMISAVFILTACSPAATGTPGMDNPVGSEGPVTQQPGGILPRPTDSNQQRGNVYLASTELLTMESYPLQFSLMLKGSLPTPCNKLKVDASPPDAQNKIVVDVYSITNPDMACAQMLQPFEKTFPLGSFPAGHYTLWVNGKKVAEFDA